jgi:hypothetical protein
VAILLSNTFANALLQHSGSSIADQFGGGSVVVYSGTPPTGPNESLSGNTVLATFTFAAAASWASPTTGVETLDFVSQTVTAAASGTATFFRVLNSGAAALLQGTVAASGGDFNLSSVAITSGDNVAITGTPTIAWTTT